MSAQTSTLGEAGRQAADVRFGSEADICSAKRYVRFTPENDIKCDRVNIDYSITSSACASSAAGISRPSALAVFRLMTNTKFDD